MTYERYPHGGYVVLDGSRFVAWVHTPEHARAITALLSRPKAERFERADEDRADYRENHVTYLKKGRKQ